MQKNSQTGIDTKSAKEQAVFETIKIKQMKPKSKPKSKSKSTKSKPNIIEASLECKYTNIDAKHELPISISEIIIFVILALFIFGSFASAYIS